MRATIDGGLRELERQHPEWAPWLVLVAPVLENIHNRDWDKTVPDSLTWRNADAPLLAGAALSFDSQSMARFAQTASVVEAALNYDEERLNSLAAEANSDPERFRAIAALVPMPFLYACNRRWGIAAPENWTHGYCVVCGAWPAFAEECGVDRIRYLRCGRCGSAWQALRLLCPYCGMAEHSSLASLVVEEGKSAIEVCKRCAGYVKVFTTLRPALPSKVLYEELASVTLDLAAATRGYRRPENPGYRLDVTVHADSGPVARQH